MEVTSAMMQMNEEMAVRELIRDVSPSAAEDFRKMSQTPMRIDLPLCNDRIGSSSTSFQTPGEASTNWALTEEIFEYLIQDLHCYTDKRNQSQKNRMLKQLMFTAVAFVSSIAVIKCAALAASLANAYFVGAAVLAFICAGYAAYRLYTIDSDEELAPSKWEIHMIKERINWRASACIHDLAKLYVVKKKLGEDITCREILQLPTKGKLFEISFENLKIADRTTISQIAKGEQAV